MTLVDRNILIDILTLDPVWGARSLDLFARCADKGPMLIVDAIYAECAASYASADQTTAALEGLRVQRSRMSDEALWRASRAFVEYRRRGGTKSNVLPDFFIGAQAETLGVPLLTRDGGRYATYFPDVELVKVE